MRRWTCSLLALLQGDPVAVRRFVRRQHRQLCSDHLQCRLVLIGPQGKGLNAHDLAVSYKAGNSEPYRLTLRFSGGPRCGPPAAIGC